MNYKQCRLQRDNETQVTWLPEKFAKKGKVLRLNHTNGWIVMEVWASATEEFVLARERDNVRWAKGRGLNK